MATRRLFDGAQAELGILPVVATTENIQARTASFAGSSDFSATVGSSVNASFAGGSSFSATSATLVARTASFAGAGALSATSASIVGQSGTFAGSGSVSATSAAIASRTASFAGLSTFSATSGSIVSASASFAGSSSFAGVVIPIGNGILIPQGTGGAVSYQVDRLTQNMLDPAFRLGELEDA